MGWVIKERFIYSVHTLIVHPLCVRQLSRIWGYIGDKTTYSLAEYFLVKATDDEEFFFFNFIGV